MTIIKNISLVSPPGTNDIALSVDVNDGRMGWVERLVLTGVAAELCWSRVKGPGCSFGIILDRMEECPWEAPGSEALMMAMREYLSTTTDLWIGNLVRRER